MSNQKGFTLIELLVVISIIAILSTVGIVLYTGAQKKTRDTRRLVDVEAIGRAWELNISKVTPRYPALIPTWFAGNTIPKDPLTGESYSYTGANESTGADTYRVCATLEEGGTHCTSNQQ